MSTSRTLEGVDIAALYDAIDRFDAEAFGAFFAEDATYVFSNYPATHGRAGIVASAVAFWNTLETLQHKVVDVIPFTSGFVSQLEITFGLAGGRVVTLPVAVITRTARGQITDHRIYVNESPLADE